MIRKYNYVLLLVGILVMLIGGSLATEHARLGTQIIVDASLAGMLVLGVWSLLNSKATFVAGLILAGVAVLLTIGAYATSIQALQNLSLLVVLVFFLLTCIVAVHDVLLGGQIDINRLIGAACIYLLSGALWGIVYFLLNVVSPGSFDGVGGETWSEQLNEFTYHSFVTLTTLGYGDVTPALPIARTLSYLEAVLGQLYLTVLVAALVGIHIANRQVGAWPAGTTGES